MNKESKYFMKLYIKMTIATFLIAIIGKVILHFFPNVNVFIDFLSGYIVASIYFIGMRNYEINNKK